MSIQDDLNIIFGDWATQNINFVWKKILIEYRTIWILILEIEPHGILLLSKKILA